MNLNFDNESQKYEFYVDTVNDGTMDLWIESVEFQGVDGTDLSKYLDYEVTYTNHDGYEKRLRRCDTLYSLQTYKQSGENPLYFNKRNIHVVIKIKDDVNLKQVKLSNDVKFAINYTTQELTMCDNSYDLVYDGDKTPIIIIGISSLLSNNYDIDAAFSYFKESNSNSNLYSIVVFHEPDLTDYVLKNKNADLLLAGHSHNGYVKLPFVNGLIKSDGAMEYYNERYEFSNSKLFISSGIGTNGSGVRFMCQPSVNFFRLSSK